MKRETGLMMVGLLVILMSLGCRQGASETPAPAAFRRGTRLLLTGTVAETIDSGGYTYVLVKSGSTTSMGHRVPAAIRVGDTVRLPKDMPMRNFTSKTLNRTFDLIYFVPQIKAEGAGQAPPHLPPGSPRSPGRAPVAHRHRPGHPIRSRQAGEAQRWVHRGGDSCPERPSRGAQGARARAGREVQSRDHEPELDPHSGRKQRQRGDLALTSDAAVKVGNVILASGILTTNEGSGAGYKYDVIIENAELKVEAP